MTRRILFVAAAVLAAGALWMAAAPTVAQEKPADGFKDLFNGKDLTGWEGDAKFWKVEDGAITGTTTKENPTKGNTFLLWKDGVLKDFELRVKFKIEAHNSGIQFRSKHVGNFVVSGYQADFDFANTYTGLLYEEKGRGIMAKRGTKLTVTAEGKKEVTGQTGAEKDLLAAIKKGEWNEYTIIAKGNHLTLKINDVLMSEMIDHQESKRAMEGILALQLHAGPPMKVHFKDIRLKELKG